MGLKWQRSKAWDDRFFPAWAWPLKAGLRTFSSIWFGVSLLVFVALYAVLASVPIGILALAPTYLIYGLIVLALIAAIAAGPWLIARAAIPRTHRAGRFVACVIAVLTAIPLGWWVWRTQLWPALHYDPVTGSGLLLFADFIEHWKSTTLRRLPGFEMTEAQFYSWWPLRWALVLFVISMIVATVRRIEFKFVNLGVLTVHAGIVMIGLGSLYYRATKLEGDTLLLAGEVGPDGRPTVGPPQDGFFDNADTALWVTQRSARIKFESRPLRGVPRYNEYGLSAGSLESAGELSGTFPPLPREGVERLLDVEIPSLLRTGDASTPAELDPDIRLRAVGYATYAKLERDWVRVEPSQGLRSNPLRTYRLIASTPDGPNPSPAKDAFVFTLLPSENAKRVSEAAGLLGVEATQHMPEARWQALASPLPSETTHALVIRIPASNHAEILPLRSDAEVTIGSTGYRVKLKELRPTPPFPIITEGYKGASSSIAIVRVTPPKGPSFDRWVYHRFPEISQDMLEELNERGMPRRRDADPGIEMEYLDAAQLQVYIDERPDGSSRVLVRLPGGSARTYSFTPEQTAQGWVIHDLAPRGVGDPQLDLASGLRWPHAEQRERPIPVPEPERNREFIGTHQQAALGVEVSLVDPQRPERAPTHSQVVWVPFSKYIGGQLSTERQVQLPDGRSFTMIFGRRRHRFEDFMLQLADFKLEEYEHRGAPKDYISSVRVIPREVPVNGAIDAERLVHTVSLNAPLEAPFTPSDSRSWLSNLAGSIASKLSPSQFKFSQAGWDAGGWEQTRAQADRGELPAPYASFTILQVGNNPGIHVVALGGILIGIGTPWAFYVKPWLLRRQSRRLQAQIKANRPVAVPASGEPRVIDRPLTTLGTPSMQSTP
jgi:hypothetical protein